MEKTETKKLVKGRSTAFLVSAGVHIVLLLLAGTFVVFNIVKPPEVKFTPVEKIDRPVMKLKKLQVKVQQDSRPKQTPERISTETPKVISDIVLPEFSGGAADGLGTGVIGGFEMMEDLSKMTVLGGQNSVGNDLVGTYYYLMQYRSGAPNQKMTYQAGAGETDGLFDRVVKEFFDKGWDPAVLDPYWRAPVKLYATQIFIPPTISTIAPEKFGDDRGVEAAFWLVHYKGRIAHPEGGRFRFLGFADNLLYVRINGETVLDASWLRNRENKMADWESSADDDLKYQLANGHYRIGDWFEMRPGEPVEMEVLVGEAHGGNTYAMLCVQQEGVDYPERDFGGPLLPIFKTAPPPQHLIDEMSYTLPEGHVDFTGGPVFSVY